MHYKPNRHVDVPSTDLLTWIFGNEGSHEVDRPVTRLESGSFLKVLTGLGRSFT
jgi:hypothetical protein